jgi:hypothetical protein
MSEHGKYPFFPDNIQFWYETKRSFGASSYGASEFGEVMATVNRIASGAIGDSEWSSETRCEEMAHTDVQRHTALVVGSDGFGGRYNRHFVVKDPECRCLVRSPRVLSLLIRLAPN